MKKLLSVILAALLLALITAVPVYATEDDSYVDLSDGGTVTVEMTKDKELKYTATKDCFVLFNILECSEEHPNFYIKDSDGDRLSSSFDDFNFVSLKKGQTCYLTSYSFEYYYNPLDKIDLTVKVAETTEKDLKNGSVTDVCKAGGISVFSYTPEEAEKANVSVKVNGSKGVIADIYTYSDWGFLDRLTYEQESEITEVSYQKRFLEGKTYYLVCLNPNDEDVSVTAEMVAEAYPELTEGKTTEASVSKKESFIRYKSDYDGILCINVLNKDYEDNWRNDEICIYQCDSGFNEIKGVLSDSENSRMYFRIEKEKTYYFKLYLYFADDNNISKNFELSLSKLPIAELKYNESAEVKIEVEGDKKFFKFVPEKDMVYSFKIEGDEGGAIAVCNSKLSSIDDKSDMKSSDSINVKLNRWETYYIQAGFTKYHFYSHDDGEYHSKELTGSYNLTAGEYIPESITMDEEKEVNITSSGDEKEFRFVPEKDMLIEFYEVGGDSDIEGCVLDSDRHDISIKEDSVRFGFPTLAFVEAGETYFLTARYYWSSDTGSFKVKIREFEPEEIKYNEPKTVTFEENTSSKWFKFTAPYDTEPAIKSDSGVIESDDEDSVLSFTFYEDSQYGSSYPGLKEKGTTSYIRVDYENEDEPELTTNITLFEGCDTIKLGETKKLEYDKNYKYTAEKDAVIMYSSDGMLDDDYLQFEVVKAERDWYDGYKHIAGIASQGNFHGAFPVSEGETYFMNIDHETEGDVMLTLLALPEESIELNTEYEVDTYGYFKFVPDRDMTVSFESVNSDVNAYGSIYDDYMYYCKTNNFTKVEKCYENKGDGNDFAVHYDLEKGNTYYLGAQTQMGSTGKYKVILKADAAPAPAVAVGDVNGDSVVDILDATVIQKYAVEKATLTDAQKAAADVNDDGVVDILDASDIQKYTVEKIIEFKKKA